MSAIESSPGPLKCSSTPPVSANKILGIRRQYSSDATIVLVGLFGAGKKTLGIIASVALRRRFVDFDAVFNQEVQSSPQEFIACHGLARYRDLELQISKDLLAKYDTGCVIVGLGGTASPSQRTLLTECGRRHPVIYVRRDEHDLQRLSGTTPDKFSRIFEIVNAFFESCTNFDFFNHTQSESQSAPTLPAYLKLKETERVFVAFLHRIFGRDHRQVFSVDPFSRSHTYALQVPVTYLDQPELDLESLESGADAITLVVQPEDITSTKLTEKLVRHIALLRKHSRVPIIVDVSAPHSTHSTFDYHKALATTLRLAPDALTCCLECDHGLLSELNFTKGYTKIIGTLHNPIPIGSQAAMLSTVTELSRDSECDALRVTGEAISPDQNYACLSFSHDIGTTLEIPIITYNTGPMGRVSICLGRTLSPVVLPSLQETGITMHEAQCALTACFLQSKKTFTIFGQSVKYSLSAAMHNTAYAASGLPHVYDTLQSQDLSDIHPLLNDENHGGVTISLPYKSAILPFLDEVSSDAKDINAVNTVVLEHSQLPSGERVTIRRGYNTDYIGIRDCIHKHLSPANAVRDGTTALIIGAGGMAHAAIYACYELGVRRMCIYNRTTENAKKLADYFHQWAKSKSGVNLQLDVLCSPEDPWPSDCRLPTIVTSCIPPYELGSENPIDMLLSERWLSSRTGGVYLEVGYGPSMTRLMEQFLPRASKGWVVVDGLMVLVEQGIAQYEIFTKRPAPVHVMRRAIREQSVRHGFVHG
ncbi:Quinate repressor protein [Penicillium brasilianum]|uniref:Quinate repressor protein n=1 Tax=Penicillium brasilianum TaxID=104259 RepID=A0A1S9RRJ7_PENBI|nr:Quinate repressor protein [Penicillium brasilianum]